MKRKKIKKNSILVVLLSFLFLTVGLSCADLPFVSSDEDQLDDIDLGIDGNAPLKLDFREQTEGDERESKRLEVSQYFAQNQDLDEQTKVIMYNSIFWKETGMTQEYLKEAKVDSSLFSSEVRVVIKFTDEGYELFKDISARNIGKNIGIFLDEELIGSPLIKETVERDESIIAGAQTEEEARILVGRINKAIERNN